MTVCLESFLDIRRLALQLFAAEAANPRQLTLNLTTVCACPVPPRPFSQNPNPKSHIRKSLTQNTNILIP